jgi:hypothetical protein
VYGRQVELVVLEQKKECHIEENAASCPPSACVLAGIHSARQPVVDASECSEKDHKLPGPGDDEANGKREQPEIAPFARQPPVDQRRQKRCRKIDQGGHLHG